MAFKMNSDHDDEQIMAEINMTPLIDIMLVLLIIFMVTSSLSLESGLDIDIPKTTSKTSKKEGEAVIISLSQQGELSIQGKKLNQENSNFNQALLKQIQEELSRANTSSVIFEGDQQATLGRMIEIMDIAKSAGAKKFSIAAEQK